MIIAEAIHRFGWPTTCAITVLAGVVQVLLGMSRVARGALAISPAIVHGMLAGIGVTIVLAQLHVVLGGDTQTSPVDNLLELPGDRCSARMAPATLVGLLTVGSAGGVGPPARSRAEVPGPLAAVARRDRAVVVTGMSLDRVAVPDNLLRLELVPDLPGR